MNREELGCGEEVVAGQAALGWGQICCNGSPQKPAKRAREADPAAIERWKSQRWPELLAQAQQEQRTVVFVDESGFSQRPPRANGPGHPGVRRPSWSSTSTQKRISAIAGVSFCELWFALHEGTIRAPQVIEVIKQLQARIGQKLLLIWDGLSAHGSRAVRAFLQSLGEAVRVEPLPSYAPLA